MPWGNRKEQRKVMEPADLDQAEKLAALGLRNQDIAAFFDMSESSLKRLAGACLVRGRSKGLAAVAATAYRMATGGKHPTMTQFYLRAKGGWRDQVAAEVQVPTKAGKVRVIIPPDMEPTT